MYFNAQAAAAAAAFLPGVSSSAGMVMGHGHHGSSHHNPHQHPGMGHTAATPGVLGLSPGLRHDSASTAGEYKL
jgi:hypothetical protein